MVFRIILILLIGLLPLPLLAKQPPYNKEKAAEINAFVDQLNQSDKAAKAKSGQAHGANHGANIVPGKLTREDIAGIERYLNGITTLVADFIQIAPSGEESSGTFFLSRPGKLRWQYNPPVPILIVANGSLLTYYDYELKQISHTSPQSSLAGFLTRETIRFSGDIIITDTKKTTGLLRVTIAQKQKPDEGKVTLIFNSAPLILKKIEVIDALGQQTSIAFTNLRFGQVLDKGLFIVKDPNMFKGN